MHPFLSDLEQDSVVAGVQTFFESVAARNASAMRESEPT
jgi:hypothetical protein